MIFGAVSTVSASLSFVVSPFSDFEQDVRIGIASNASARNSIIENNIFFFMQLLLVCITIISQMGR